MAMSKATGTRQMKILNRDVFDWSALIEREKAATANWKGRWSWMADEIADLHGKLKEVSKNSKFLSNVNKNVRPPDFRSVKPIPLTTNGEYGWIPSKKDFKLEVWGTDLFQPKPLPEELTLNTKPFHRA